MPMLPSKITVSATDLRKHVGHNVFVDFGRDRERSSRKGIAVYHTGLWCETCQDGIGPVAYYSKEE